MHVEGRAKRENCHVLVAADAFNAMHSMGRKRLNGLDDCCCISGCKETQLQSEKYFK